MGKLIFLPVRSDVAEQGSGERIAPTTPAGHHSFNLPEQLASAQEQTRERRPTLGHVFGARIERPTQAKGLDAAADNLYDERMKAALGACCLGVAPSDPNSLEAMKGARTNLAEGQRLFGKFLQDTARTIPSANGAFEMIIVATE